MQIDFEDVLSGVFGRIVLYSLYLLSAIWLGSMIGGLALAAGGWSYSPGSWHYGLLRILLSPFFLINVWIVPNVALLAMITVYVMVSENSGFAVWGIIVGIESLFAMTALDAGFLPMRHQLIAWGCWLILLVMVETGIWLIRQMRMNLWARELTELKAENAMIRAQRDAEESGPEPVEDADLR